MLTQPDVANHVCMLLVVSSGMTEDDWPDSCPDEEEMNSPSDEELEELLSNRSEHQLDGELISETLESARTREEELEEMLREDVED